MRPTLLPRATAARVITRAVATLAWSAGLGIMIPSIALVIEVATRNGYPEVLPTTIGMLLLIMAGMTVCLVWMRPPVVLGYLVVATAAAIVYEVTLLTADPGLIDGELFVVTRPTLALVTIGVATTRAVTGIVWCLGGFVLSLGVTGVVSALVDVPFRPGWGPAWVLLLATVLYVSLFAIQVRERRRYPDFDRLEQVARQRAADVDLARRTTAAVHDTVLNDLTVIMNAPDSLDRKASTALLADLDALAAGQWLHVTEHVPIHSEQQARIRNELTRLVADFRWRGLTVNITGGAPNAVYVYCPGAEQAVVPALRAALENVLKHSGTDSADVEVMYSPDAVTFMISDHGVGFDVDAIAHDRLGVRDSIIARMESIGGRARIWSTPGVGTTVLVSVPVSEVLQPADISRHREEHSDD